MEKSSTLLSSLSSFFLSLFLFPCLFFFNFFLGRSSCEMDECAELKKQTVTVDDLCGLAMRHHQTATEHDAIPSILSYEGEMSKLVGLHSRMVHFFQNVVEKIDYLKGGPDSFTVKYLRDCLDELGKIIGAQSTALGPIRNFVLSLPNSNGRRVVIPSFFLFLLTLHFFLIS